MTKKILSWKLLNPLKSLDIIEENDQDIDSTPPWSYERLNAIKRSALRITNMVAINTATGMGIAKGLDYLLN